MRQSTARIQRLILAAARFMPLDPANIAYAAQVDQPEADQLLQAAQFHRVAPQVSANFSELGSISQRTLAASELLTRLSSRAEELRLRAVRHRDELHAISGELGSQLVTLKGFAVESHYPPSSGARHATDVDLFIREHDLWSVVDYLRERGYRGYRIRIGNYRPYRDRESPRFYGICPMERDGPRGLLRMDLHFGAFPACGYGLVDLPSTCLMAQGPITVANRPRSILIMMAHIVRQGFIRLRDLNDVMLTLKSDQTPLDGVEDDLERYHLLPLWRSVKELTAWLYHSPDAPNPSDLSSAAHDLLFARHRADESFADGVRLTTARRIQRRYLADLHRELFAPPTAGIRTAAATLGLYRSGRAYRLWSRPGDIAKAERFVLRPIARLSDDRARHLMASPLQRRNLERFGLQQLALPSGRSMVLSERMLMLRAGYDGQIGKSEIDATLAEVSRCTGVDVPPMD